MTTFRPSGGLVLLFVAQALATGATTASTVLASLVMSGLGHESLAGLPSTVVTLAAAVSAGLFGNVMLRFGRRPGLVWAYLLGVLGAVLGFVGAWQRFLPLFLLGAGLVGAAQGGYQQARYAVAESVPARVRGTVLGVMMLASVVGSAGTGALSGPLLTLATRLNTSSEVTGWLLAAAFLLLGAGLTLCWKPPVNASSGAVSSGAPAQIATLPSTQASRSTSAPKAPTSVFDPAVRWPALAVATSQGLMVTLMSLTPLRAHHMGMDHVQVAGLVTVHIAGMFGFGWLTGPLLDRLGSRFGYVSGALLLLCAALTALLSGAWLPGSMFLLGLGWNLCYVAGSKALTGFVGIQGRVDALAYLAAGVGTLVGGAVIARWGFAPLSLTCAVLALLPLLSAAGTRPRAAVLGVATD
ncbi:MFS transporter [Deinococcus altitudinis]|uniref:MFS transporter n=1 Tax=Deinococcus altitudinis TaxID=468914 RepID=UPI003891A9EC